MRRYPLRIHSADVQTRVCKFTCRNSALVLPLQFSLLSIEYRSLRIRDDCCFWFQFELSLIGKQYDTAFMYALQANSAVTNTLLLRLSNDEGCTSKIVRAIEMKFEEEQRKIEAKSKEKLKQSEDGKPTDWWTLWRRGLFVAFCFCVGDVLYYLWKNVPVIFPTDVVDKKLQRVDIVFLQNKWRRKNSIRECQNCCARSVLADETIFYFEI